MFDGNLLLRAAYEA